MCGICGVASLDGPLRPDLRDAVPAMALAIRHRMTADTFKETLWAYPTYSSDLKYMV